MNVSRIWLRSGHYVDTTEQPGAVMDRMARAMAKPTPGHRGQVFILAPTAQGVSALVSVDAVEAVTPR